MDQAFCGPHETIAPREFLTKALVDLDIPEGRTVSIGDRGFEQHVFRVKIDTYSDLQLLGFVPRGLAEETVRKAIRADDERASTLAEQNFSQSISSGCCECSCQGTDAAHQAQNAAPTATTTSRRASMKSSFKAIRKDIQQNLANVLSDHLRNRLDPHGPVVRGAYGAVFALDSRAIQSLISLIFQDISIGANAVLQLPATQKSLYARNITIHPTGKLATGAAYTKIWANSIARPGVMIDLNVPWLVHNL
jgi:hypothetical protein